MSIEVYKSKAEWFEKVMASDLTPATKVFAWAVSNRMYGDKIASHPGKHTIQKDTGLNPSKYKGYRDALVGCGALTAVAEQSPTGEWENYRYTLNLEWGGVPQRDTGCTPEGHRVVPTGVQGGTQRDTGVYPTGSSNTSIQSPNEPSKGDFKGAPSVATAPSGANLDSHEPEDTSDSDSSSGISEPLSSHISEFENDSISEPLTHLGPTTTGPVDNAPVSDVETCESSSTPEAAAEIDYGPMAMNRLEAAIERLRFSVVDRDHKNILNYDPGNRRSIVLRAGKPEFQHLPTAEARCEAALTAILEERRA